MIQVRDLVHRYPRASVNAVNEISCSISEGEIFGFLGPNGAGKSTVQNILSRLLPIQSGDVMIDGVPLRAVKQSYYEEIGVSFELPNLYEKLTGYENLAFFGKLFRKKTIDPDSLLRMVGLENARNKKAKDYSKGMKHRLVFARSLINRPKILFLDEPTSGLDPSTAQEIKNIIRDQRDQGTTIFLTTHNMFTAEELCDQVAFLYEGAIVAMDTPKNLKLQYGTQSVQIEYREEDQTQRAIFFMDRPEEKQRLAELVAQYPVITLHSQEATLEQIFIKLTGKELKA